MDGSSSNLDGSTMIKWTDYFEIKERWVEDGDIGSMYMYDVTIIASNIIVASYNDQKYAMKQARFKFKKISKRVEEILLG